MIGPIRPVGNYTAVESPHATETCEECGKLYPASWIPSWRPGGHATKVRSRYCGEPCRREAKRRNDRERKARQAAERRGIDVEI
jgi:hypothetical protein